MIVEVHPNTEAILEKQRRHAQGEATGLPLKLQVSLVRTYAKLADLWTFCPGFPRLSTAPRNLSELARRYRRYLARKSNPEPGHQLMWQGYLQLQLMCDGFALRDSEDE